VNIKLTIITHISGFKLSHNSQIAIAFFQNLDMLCPNCRALSNYEDKIIDTIKHPNKGKYPDQSIYIVELMGYVCMVPYVKNNDEIYLKTIIPSRKMHKHYKG
jgi:hypothetical protein